ncbi:MULTISPECIES: Na+/H+ antiporter NhaC family protein [Amycolatopsis methanolica group]|uniref:Permease n=1 Tax=Amycolatopsis methanolica 239 TaxID=1068978 RepID=A0A076N0R8_AMYME|nr:Na+/H+ antiporter NhaC family protein [Amycolatopsis methanolica]AIJ24681.1 permease [Amycolatopsis methanolica 239]
MNEVDTAAEVTAPPARARREARTVVRTVIAVAGLVLSAALGPFVSAPTLWGLVPIVLYAVLALLGMDIMVATVAAVLSALLVMMPTPENAAKLLGESLGDQVTMIGLVIMLGAGVGEILRATGVAARIVRGVMRVMGERSRTAATLGVMLSCLILVASLGTLAGALAIAAPLLLPIVARLGFTRSATASMMFIGGCAGLALAPFAGSNVAIMDAAEVGYLQYLLYGAGPLAVLSLVAGLLIVPWMQRRTRGTDDFYDPEDLGATDDGAAIPRSGRATLAFGLTLVASVVYAIISGAGTAFPLVALPVLAIVTGLAGGLSPVAIASHVYRGAARLVEIFLLFWLLAVLFAGIDALEPFQVILDTWGGSMQGLSPFLFALVIALLGWVGVPGATAAQVVLLDKVFGSLAAAVGIGPGAWVIVLLFASKADTYGPFPNANMVGSMSLARSVNLRNIIITGFLVLIPACVMYAIILMFETR